MKNNGYIPTILRICILACLIGLCNGQALAQRMIRVSGVVYNAAETKRKVPVTDAEVIVYSCKTIAEGEKLKNDLDADNLEVAMFVDPEKLPLLVVLKGGFRGIFACAGYNVGSVDLAMKLMQK